MAGKTVVTSWANFLSKAKNDGESLGAAMKRLGKRWKGPLADGDDPEYEYVKGASAPAKAKSPGRSTKKRAQSKRGSKRRSKRRGKGKARKALGRRAVEEEVAEVAEVRGVPAAAPEALAAAVGAFMDSCSLCPGCKGKVVAVLGPRS